MSDIDKNLDAKLAEIFGGRYTSAYNTPDNKTAVVTDGLTAYKKIKNKINHLFRTTTQAEGRGKICERLNENKPVAVCTVSNDLAGDFVRNLNYKEIPFVAIRKTRKFVFVFSDEDKNRADSVLQSTKDCAICYSEMYNHPDFVRWCETNDLKPFFVTGLNEPETKSLRSLIKIKGTGNKIGIFKMSDYTYSMGFNAENLVSNTDKNTRGFLESYLAMILLMSGKSGAYYTDRITDDLAADKLAALYFAPTLAEHDSVFVFNPNYPKQMLKITKDGFSRADICMDGSRSVIKESAVQKFGSYIGTTIYRKELIRMEHKRVAYSEQEILDYVSDQIKDKSIIRQKEFVLDQKIQLAKELNLIFTGRYKNEPWLNDPLKMEVQLEHFKETVVPVLLSLKEGKLPGTLSLASKEKILNIMEKSDIGLDTFGDAATRLEELSIQKEITAKEEKMPDFKSQLLNLSRQTQDTVSR